MTHLLTDRSRLSAPPPPRAAAGRTVAGRVALAGVVAVLGWYCLRGPLVDLWVYRDGVLAALDGRRVYEIGLGELGLPFTYPPFGILALTPLAVAPPLVTALLWFAVGVAALVDGCRSLQAWGRRQGWRVRVGVPATAAVALLAEPVLSTLAFGQVNLVIMALVLRDVSGRGPLPRGVLIGLVAGVKLTPAAFVLYYAVTGRWPAVRNAVATAVGTVVLGAVLLPGPSAAFWLGGLFTDPARPGSPWYLTNQSLTGVLTRALGPDLGVHAALLAAVPVVLLAAVTARLAHRSGRGLLAFATVSFVPLLISPISWSHHWVFLLVPAYAALFGPWAADRARRAFAVAVLAATLLQPLRLLPGGADVELRYPWWLHLMTAMYPLLALAWVALLQVELRRPDHQGGRSRWRSGERPSRADTGPACDGAGGGQPVRRTSTTPRATSTDHETAWDQEICAGTSTAITSPVRSRLWRGARDPGSGRATPPCAPTPASSSGQDGVVSHGVTVAPPPPGTPGRRR